MNKITKTDEEWKKILTPEQYRILRGKETEAPGTGTYYHTTERGVYVCVACGNELFSSDTKFDSGSGWPSFWAPISKIETTLPSPLLSREGEKTSPIELKPDASLGMERTEVTCNRCGGHLGHVFPDGPQPTGKRYCINSAVLKFLEVTPRDTKHSRSDLTKD